MNKFEDFVRDNYKEIHEMTITYQSDEYPDDDYLRLLNYCTSEEELEIRVLLKDIKQKLERICDIQDDCYSR